MGWRSQTFLDVQTRLLGQVPSLRSVDVFNNQFEDYKADTGNEEQPLPFPLVLVEFAGGDWMLYNDRLTRYADPYLFRLHVGQELQYDSDNHSAQQEEALTHLDFIDEVINALDDWTGGMHVERFLFQFEQLDTQRTHLIEHILEFKGKVLDDSLKTKVEAERTTQQAEDDDIIRTGQSQHEDFLQENEVLFPGGNPFFVL